MDRYLIVGLGNPGKKYAETRHNIGFMCVDALAKEQQISINTSKYNAFVGEGTIEEKRVLIAKPQTYMNNSGVSVRGLADFYQIPPERIIVVFDDLDTPLGTLRIRAQGGAGGQNGMRSIIQHLGTQDFPRIRFGIDRPPGRMDAAAYVLLPFKSEDAALLQETIDRVGKAITIWLKDGIDMAMTRQNGTIEQVIANAPKPPKPEEKITNEE